MPVKTYKLALLPGDGIGPEVVEAAMGVLRSVAGHAGFEIETESFDVGGAAIDSTGDPFPEATERACLSADAVLLGAVGGPAWDHVSGEIRPERGLLRMRKALGAFANLRPSIVPDSLADSSPLRRDRVTGADLLVVRELIGGIYFGEPRLREGDMALDTMRYSTGEVERIAHVAFAWARRRGGRVTSVDKANVLASSRLWRDTVTALHAKHYSDLELDHMYVDNAAMQLVRDPRQFDVVLTGNLFGDILSDISATLPGSLGILPSASVGGPVGIFEPVHGSAPDLAGLNVANPLGTILSTAMMLDAFGEAAAAAAIRSGVDLALQAGLRTADLTTTGGTAVGTHEMAESVTDYASKSFDLSVQTTS